MNRAEPFELTSFEEEARALVQRAGAEALEILRRAQGEAAAVRETARQEGIQQGLETGRAAGTAAPGLTARARSRP